MSGTIHLTAVTRDGIYAELLPQLRSLLEGETDLIARMANVSAALMEAFKWHWIGFYRVDGDTLVLGPFQGPVACQRIARGRGVCGTAWERNAAVVVPDVELFPGHIACSPLSRSEVVVPVRDASGAVMAVLDIDSAVPGDFGDSDAQWLARVAQLITP